jgi:anti-sigma factor RsiW
MQTTDDERLSAYLDGELDELQSARLERELREDRVLREALSTLRALRSHVQRVGPVRAPERLFDRIMDDVDRDMANARRYRWFRRPFGIPIEGLAVAAVAILVLYAALPASPDVHNAVELEFGPAVRLETTPADEMLAVAVPEGWSLSLPDGVSMGSVEAAWLLEHAVFTASSADGQVSDERGHIRLDASRVEALKARLESLGVSITPTGQASALQGSVELQIEVVALED